MPPLFPAPPSVTVQLFLASNHLFLCCFFASRNGLKLATSRSKLIHIFIDDASRNGLMKLATSRSKLIHIFIDDASRNGLMKLATSRSKLIHIFIDDASRNRLMKLLEMD